jgi:capsular polysaccharide biosynthesis protein
MSTSAEILQKLVRWLGLLVLTAAIGALCGYLYGANKTPTYSSQAFVLVVGAPGESVAAVNFAQAYGRMATQGPVSEAAAATLGPAAEGLSRVTASTSPEAPIIEITAMGSDPGQTADVADAVAGALVDFGIKYRSQTHVDMALIASATPPSAPTSPNPPMALAVGTVAGLLVGGLAVLAGVGRSSRTGRRDTPADAADAAPDTAGTIPAQPSPARTADTAKIDAVPPADEDPVWERAGVDGGRR